MKNILPIAFLLFIFLMLSCKKEPQADSVPDPMEQPYNICYKDWQPDSTIHGEDTLIIDLGCSNSHYKIMLIANIKTYGGTIPPKSIPYYIQVTDVVPLDDKITISCVYIGYDEIGNYGYINLAKNDKIDDNLHWEHGITLKGLNGRWGPFGYWSSPGIKGYVGVRLTTVNGVKYGWLKLQVPESHYTRDLTIEAQAMNDNVNQPIRAGQTQ